MSEMNSFSVDGLLEGENTKDEPPDTNFDFQIKKESEDKEIISVVEIKSEPEDSSSVRIKTEPGNKSCTFGVKAEIDDDYSDFVKRGVANLTEVLKETLLPKGSQSKDVEDICIPDLTKVKLENVSDKEKNKLTGMVSDSLKVKREEHQDAENTSFTDVSNTTKQDIVKKEEVFDPQEESSLRKCVIDLLNESGYIDKATDENIQHIVGWLMNGILPTEAELHSLFNPPSNKDKLITESFHLNKELNNCVEIKSKSDAELTVNNSHLIENYNHSKEIKFRNHDKLTEDTSHPIEKLDDPIKIRSESNTGSEMDNNHFKKNLNDSVDIESKNKSNKLVDEGKSLSINKKSQRGRSKKGGFRRKKGVLSTQKQQTASHIAQNDNMLSLVEDSMVSDTEVDSEMLSKPPRYSLRKRTKNNLFEERLSPTEEFWSDESDEWSPEQTRKQNSDAFLHIRRKRKLQSQIEGAEVKKRTPNHCGNDPDSVGNEQSQGKFNKHRTEDNMMSEKCNKKKVIIPGSQNLVVELDKSVCDQLLQNGSDKDLTKSSKANDKDNCERDNSRVKRTKFVTARTETKQVKGTELSSPTTNITTEIKTFTNIEDDEVITNITKTEIKTVTRTKIVKKLPCKETTKTPSTTKEVVPSTKIVTSTTTISPTETGNKTAQNTKTVMDDVHACTKCILAFCSRSLLQRHMYRLHYDEFLRLRNENFWE